MMILRRPRLQHVVRAVRCSRRSAVRVVRLFASFRLCAPFGWPRRSQFAPFSPLDGLCDLFAHLCCPRGTRADVFDRIDDARFEPRVLAADHCLRHAIHLAVEPAVESGEQAARFARERRDRIDRPASPPRCSPSSRASAPSRTRRPSRTAPRQCPRRGTERAGDARASGPSRTIAWKIARPSLRVCRSA